MSFNKAYLLIATSICTTRKVSVKSCITLCELPVANCGYITLHTSSVWSFSNSVMIADSWWCAKSVRVAKLFFWLNLRRQIYGLSNSNFVLLSHSYWWLVWAAAGPVMRWPWPWAVSLKRRGLILQPAGEKATNNILWMWRYVMSRNF